MTIEKISISLFEQAEQEYARSISARSKAIEDYNIMMGNLEDPSDMEDEEDE